MWDKRDIIMTDSFKINTSENSKQWALSMKQLRDIRCTHTHTARVLSESMGSIPKHGIRVNHETQGMFSALWDFKQKASCFRRCN